MTGRQTAQTVTEMMETMTAERDRQLAPNHRGQSIYRAQSAEYAEDKLRDLIGYRLEDLTQFATAEPVSLEDTAEVQRRAVVYLRCCQQTATFPSNLGLSRSIGYSNRALEIWRSKKPDHPTARFLQVFSELCADILHDSGLKNNCNSIISIFLSKSVYGFTENNELTIRNGGTVEDPGAAPSIAEIRERYAKYDEVE